MLTQLYDKLDKLKIHIAAYCIDHLYYVKNTKNYYQAIYERGIIKGYIKEKREWVDTIRTHKQELHGTGISFQEWQDQHKHNAISNKELELIPNIIAEQKPTGNNVSICPESGIQIGSSSDAEKQERTREMPITFKQHVTTKLREQFEQLSHDLKQYLPDGEFKKQAIAHIQMCETDTLNALEDMPLEIEPEHSMVEYTDQRVKAMLEGNPNLQNAFNYHFDECYAK
jgi:hypothetical protein